MPNTQIEARLVLDWKAQIAEAPVWDEASGRFWCVDNVVGRVIALSDDWTIATTIERNRAVAAALPVRSGGLILAEGCDFTLLDDDGNTRPFARIDADPSQIRINEAKCDPQGRIWAGTVSSTVSVGAGALYRLDPDGACRCMVQGLTIGNGMAWSPDGSTMYLVDSPTGRIDAFDFDAAAGALSNRRTIVSFPYGRGWADGMSVDREGGLWVAVPLAGEVRHYDPQGRLVGEIRVPARFVSSCAFGGPDCATMLITSASIELPPALVAAVGFDPATETDRSVSDRWAGGLFIAHPGTRGLAGAPFGL